MLGIRVDFFMPTVKNIHANLFHILFHHSEH